MYRLVKKMMEKPCSNLGNYCNFTIDCCAGSICYENTICIQSIDIGEVNKFLLLKNLNLSIVIFDLNFLIHMIIFLIGLFLILRFYYITYYKNTYIINRKINSDSISLV